MRHGTVKKALENVSGTSFIGLDTETEVALKGGKSNPYKGRVTKKMTGASVMVFSNTGGSAYESVVKNRLIKEGKDPMTFSVGPRAWGTRIEGTPFIEHNEKLYLEVIFLKSGKTEYFVDGKPQDDMSEIPGFEKKEEATVVNPESQGGIENKVVIRTFDVGNVTEIRVDHDVYR